MDVPTLSVAVQSTSLDPYLAPLVFALSGAGARFIMSPEEKSILSFFANMITGTFTGAIIFCFTGVITSVEVRSGVVGLSSYMGGDLLPTLAKLLKKRIEKEGDR